MSNSDINYKNIIANPLTDRDVENLMQKVARADAKLITPIFNEYNNVLNSILSMMRKQAVDEEDIVEVDRAKRIIGLCPMEEKLFRTKDKIWNVRNQILNKDLNFFMTNDYSGMIKNDQNRAFIEAMIEIIKENFIELTKKEQDFYWSKFTKLLHLVAKFKEIIKEYN